MDGVITQMDAGIAEIIRKIDSGEAQIHQMTSEHLFTPGLYTRTCNIPADTLAVTERHKTEHPFVILKGEVLVYTENEGSCRYKAPCRGVTKPGTQRFVYAETDTVWITFHPTTETDVEKIGHQILDIQDHPTIPAEKIHGWLTQLPKPLEEIA